MIKGGNNMPPLNDAYPTNQGHDGVGSNMGAGIQISKKGLK